MDERGAYLHQLDQAWGHTWESLAAVLEGVTEDEAAWQPPAYAGEPRDGDAPAPGSILWHVAHLGECKRHYALHLRKAMDAAASASGDAPAPRTLAEARTALAAAHDEQRRALTALDAGALDGTAGEDMPMREFLAMSIRHDAWHGGQIAVARRLWRHSRGG